MPAYLRRCAPWLEPDEVRRLQRADAQAWTVSDLPLLDAARQRLGDPEASRRRRRHDAAVAAERAQMDRVVDDLLQLDDEDGMMAQLRQEGIRDALVDDAALPEADADLLAGPFAHIVVDEAQELTDAEWQMLLLRCPSRSFTIVGDRAQARHGFTESWQERLERIGLDRIEPGVPEHQLPDAGRGDGGGRAGHPGRAPGRQRADLDPQQRRPRRARIHVGPGLDPRHLARRAGRRDRLRHRHPRARGGHGRASSRVRSLTPELSKGLEFDLVVLVDPEAFGTGIEGAVDRYVAMTRATQRLVILTTSAG